MLVNSYTHVHRYYIQTYICIYPCCSILHMTQKRPLEMNERDSNKMKTNTPCICACVCLVYTSSNIMIMTFLSVAYTVYQYTVQTSMYLARLFQIFFLYMEERKTRNFISIKYMKYVSLYVLASHNITFIHTYFHYLFFIFCLLLFLLH